MSNQTKTKEQLTRELRQLRRRVAKLQASENQRQQAEAEIQRRLQETTVLSQVTTAITSATDMTGALKNVCAELARFLQIPQAAFAILNPQRTAAEVIADYHPPDSPSAMGFAIPVAGNPSMAHVLEHKTPLAITDAQTDPLLAPIHDLMRQRNIQSILIVPIIVGGEILGTLGLDAFQRRVFSDSEVNLVQHVTNQAGHVLLRKRAEAEREQLLTALDYRSTQLQTAAEVSRAVSSILDPETLIPQVVDLVRKRFGLYYAGLFLVDQTGEWTSEPGKWAVLRAGTGEAGRRMLKQGHKLELGGDSMISWCIANKQARIAPDESETLPISVEAAAMHFENPLLPETRSELALPLISRGQAIGALTIQSSQEAAFTKDDVAALQTMADQLANAIANARLHNQAQQEITRREQAADALQESETRLRAVVDSLQIGIVIIDAETHKIVDANPAAIEVIGAPKEKIVGHVCHKFICPAEKGKCPITDLGQAIDKAERVLVNVNGENIPILKTVTPIVLSGRSHLVESFLDITERRQAEESLQKAHEELAQYTENLERRTSQLQVGAEVAREAAAILDVQQLLNTALHLISERFGFYHASAFLIDEPGEYAVLRAVSSEGGRRMLERGHKLPVGRVGIVGYVAATGEPRIALDIGKDAVVFDNADLPETRSEMGLPLKVRARTIGVLDVQSQYEAAFSEDDVVVLQTLADQLAIAVDNARLVERTETQLHELSILHGEYSAAAWAELASPEHSLGYVYDRIDVMPADKLPAPAFDLALTRGETVAFAMPDTTEKVLATPLKLRDQVIGTLGIQETGEGREWSPGEIALIEAVGEQVTQALESARLFADAQQRVQEQEGLARIAALAGSTLDLDELLAQLVEETVQLLGAQTGVLLVLDEDEKALVDRYFSSNVGLRLTPGEWRVPLDAPGFEQGIFSRGDDYYTNQAQTDPNIIPAYRAYVKALGAENFCGAALRVRDRSIGELYIADRPGGFGPEQSRLLRTVTSYAANAIENARLFEETRIHAEELAVLNDLSKALATHLNMEAVLEETYRGASRLLDTTNFFIGLYDPDKDEINLALDVSEPAESQDDKQYINLLYDPEKDEVDFDVSESGDDKQAFVWGGAFPADQGLVGYIIQNRTSMLIEENMSERLEDIKIEQAGRIALSWLGVPLLVGDRVLGVMAVQSYTTPRAYDEHDRGLLTAIAGQTAIALQNAYLFQETETALAETQALYRAGEIISRLGSPEETFQTLANALVEQLGYVSSWLALVDKQTQMLRGVAAAGIGVTEDIRSEQIPLDPQVRNPAIQAVLNQEPVVVNDVPTDERAADLDNETRAVLGRMVNVPILIGNEAAGILAVNRPSSLPEITDRDVEVLLAVADQAAVALQNARLLDETQRRATQLAAAAEVARGATAILEVDQLLDETVHLISEQFGFYHAGVFLVDEQNEHAVLRAASSDGGRRMLERSHRLQVGKVGIVGYVAGTGKPRVALDVGKDAVHFFNPDLPDTRSEMGLPLRVRDQVIGVLDVQSIQKAAFSEDDVAVLQTLANQLATAIENARLFEETQRRARRERLIREVTAKVWASTDLEDVLKTAAQELGKALGTSHALVRLGTPPRPTSSQVDD